MFDHRSALVAELFKSAMEREEAQWASFLDQACPDDLKLRGEVESLLRFGKNTDEFLEEPPGLSMSFGSEPIVGQTIGSYRIISHLGSGGMGDVQLGMDDKLGRKVAVKLLRFGAWTGRHVHREGNILAKLNHPNIAQLHDADVTPDGLRYVVMEYVEGIRIDDYCRVNQVSVPDRLKLFQKVCNAVHYAHQHLIIHRDIKASNILVTQAGEPKLLDFGIAKLLEPERQLLGDSTVTLGPLMTPEYTSPEHLRGEPVTTASDTYSLGILLYELLTGQRPYRIATRRPDEIVRIVCDTEPPRPSVVLAKQSGNRKSKVLAGDLDTIVLMALRKEPQRRYASVEQFSEDIGRYLSNRPVRARKDTVGYRAAKFVGRNKLAGAAGALIMLSLIAGLTTTFWEARIARKQAWIAVQERDRAQIETAKAEQINQFLQDTLGFADPGWFSPSHGKGPNATIGEALNYAAGRAESELAKQPEVLARILFTIGTAYRNLAQLDVAEGYLRKSLALHRQVSGNNNSLQLADALNGVANILAVKGDYDAALPLSRESLAIYRKGFGQGRIGAIPLGNGLNDLGLSLMISGRPEEAEPFLREAVELSGRYTGNERIYAGIYLTNLARTRASHGYLDEAENLYRSSIEEYRKLSGERTELATSLTFLGELLSLKGKEIEAETILREAVAIAKRLTGDSSPNVALASMALAQTLYLEGDYAGAEKVANGVLQILRPMLPEGHIGPTTAMITLGLVLNKTGRAAEAESILRQALATREHVLPKGYWQIAVTKEALGECLTTQKRYSEAEPLLLESYNDLKTSQGEGNPRTIDALQHLVALYEAASDSASLAKYRTLLRRQ